MTLGEPAQLGEGMGSMDSLPLAMLQIARPGMTRVVCCCDGATLHKRALKVFLGYGQTYERSLEPKFSNCGEHLPAAVSMGGGICEQILTRRRINLWFRKEAHDRRLRT